jgi:hypothetical protein
LTYLLKESIAESAIKYRLPTISNANQYAEAGLLMSYGRNGGSLPACRDLRRQDSPWSQARRPAGRTALEVRADHQFEDREGARLTIPQSMLLRAEEVIQ